MKIKQKFIILFKQINLETKLFGFVTFNNGKKIEILGNHDFEIPLKQIYQIITPTNILINKAEDKDFLQTDFNLMESNQWVSFFPM